MKWKFLENFPTHQATVFVALVAISLVTIVVISRLALGLVFPDGYDTYLWMLAALCGVAGAWGVGKRLSDYDYAAIKAGQAPAPKIEANTAIVTPAQPAPTPPAKPANVQPTPDNDPDKPAP